MAVAAGTAREALSAARDALEAAGVDTPRLDAEVLLAEATGLSRAALLADGDEGIEPAAARRFGEMVRRRIRREPVAYILGRKGFRRIELAVDRRVLIPRPETELLVEVALELQPATVLDVGTGSGAIALAVADELPGVSVVGVDTSPAAIDVARANADRLGFGSEEGVRFALGASSPGMRGYNSPRPRRREPAVRPRRGLGDACARDPRVRAARGAPRRPRRPEPDSRPPRCFPGLRRDRSRSG